MKKTKRNIKKAKKIEPIVNESRNALMLRAKDRGIKNFRVLNKAELGQVLADSVTQAQIDEVVAGAVARWKAGWGSKGKRNEFRSSNRVSEVRRWPDSSRRVEWEGHVAVAVMRTWWRRCGWPS